jgi:outer membrane protein insertion porin family
MRDGSVDIEYQVVEKPSDQIELSGGWSGYGFIGTLGVVFNNFAARKIFKIKDWRGPLPSGDGQRLSLRMQASGKFYQTYSMTFTEPWLGGKKPNSFTVGITHSVSRTGGYYYNNLGNNFGDVDDSEAGKILITGVSVSLGRRLKFPDDFFTLSNGLSYTRYGLDNYSFSQFGFTSGTTHNFNFNTTISRSSIDNPMFPRGGSNISLSITLTPPYSLWFPQRMFHSIENNLPQSEKDTLGQQRMVEYHKWMLDASQFISLAKNLVINVRAHFGFLGYYNPKYYSKFERFELGGDGLAMNNYLLGTEIIGLRGYENRSLNPYFQESNNQIRSSPGVAYNKFVFETRYLISPNPAATIWVHAFAEGGNNFNSLKNYNPFKLYRAAGVGARIFMPAFGLIGVDYGYGFDEVPGYPTANERRFMFTIGQQFR